MWKDKKRLLSVALAVVMAVCLVGCSSEEMRTEQVLSQGDKGYVCGK